MVSEELAERNTQIRNKVMKMMAEKSSRGKQKYTSGYIFDKIAAEYELKPRTVKNIFWESGTYRLPVSPQQNIAHQV